MPETRVRTSLPLKLLIFFSRNPDEVLTVYDVAKKWDVSYYAAQRAMHRLAEAGWLKRSRVPNTNASLYEIGRTLEKEIQ